MFRKLIVLSGILLCAQLSAQVPFFGSCPEKGVLLGYSSLSYYSDYAAWETYTFMDYSFTDHLAAGVHVCTYGNTVDWGPEILGGYKVNDYFAFSLNAIPSFDLTDDFRFLYASLGLYMNGKILPDYQLFWLTNTFGTVYRDASTTWLQYWYLGSLIPLGGTHRIVPMAGCTHSWRFEQHPDLALGLVYSYGPWTFVAWCGQIFSGSPLLTVGFEFDLPTKI